MELNHSNQSVLPSGLQLGDNDSRILAVAMNLANDGLAVTVVSKDLPLRVKASSIGLAAEEYRAELAVDSGWTGMADITLSSEQMAQLYDRYLEPVYRFIRFQVAQEDAEDLAETVFLKAFEGLPDFKTGKRMTNFRAWIYRIARNLVIDHYRTRKTLLPLDPEPGAEFISGADLERPEEAFQLRESADRIRAAVEKLEEPFGPVIVMRFAGGLSYREVADALGISIGTVMSRLFYARQKLKTLLADLTTP